MTTKDEVKALWKLCFTDSDEFTDLYFDLRYKDDINMAVREEGKIISALQMISYPMTFCGETIATSYVSGACTHPDYIQTATFIKRVFAHTLRDSEISTIERKMSHTESECRIKLDRKIA